MPFACTWEQRPNALGLDERVAILHDAQNRLEIWPALGFNAFRWHVAGQELLYRNPRFFDEKRPTRSGFPILFPFPNRIRAGRFTWPTYSPLPLGEGPGARGELSEAAGAALTPGPSPKGRGERQFQLPLGDPAQKNAIHGFAVNRAWRVIDQGADADSAWVTGEFHGSVDAPETLELWPADYRLRLTYRLFDRILRVEADADNPDTRPLPFGIGYHPYFQLAPFGGAQADLTVGAAHKLWELADNLPTGKLLDVDEPRDLRHGQKLAALHLDDVMTDLHAIAYDQQDHLGLVGVIQHPGGERMLTLWTGDDFREMVLFTPPHREAICLEPYTCTTDAINLSSRGLDAGLRVLQPGEHWQGIVEMHLSS